MQTSAKVFLLFKQIINRKQQIKFNYVCIEKSLLHEKLDTFTNDTVAKEETMLTNFLVLLNTKKEEIKRLKENGSAGIPIAFADIFF